MEQQTDWTINCFATHVRTNDSFLVVPFAHTRWIAFDVPGIFFKRQSGDYVITGEKVRPVGSWHEETDSNPGRQVNTWRIMGATKSFFFEGVITTARIDYRGDVYCHGVTTRSCWVEMLKIHDGMVTGCELNEGRVTGSRRGIERATTTTNQE